MGVWNIATPAGTDPISQGDDRIREMKVAIEDALQGDAVEGTESVFPGASPATAPVFRYRGLKGTTGARPAFGQYGLYANTTLNTLQRDSGSAWEDVATLIPSGTKMAFYQASPPVGWTAVAVNDKFLRVVTAGTTGGTNGGTVAPSAGNGHTHAVASHTHDLGNHTHAGPSHTHTVPRDGWGANLESPATSGRLAVGEGVQDRFVATADNTTGSSGTGNTGVPSVNISSGTALVTDSGGASVYAFADVCIGTKD